MTHRFLIKDPIMMHISWRCSGLARKADPAVQTSSHICAGISTRMLEGFCLYCRLPESTPQFASLDTRRSETTQEIEKTPTALRSFLLEPSRAKGLRESSYLCGRRGWLRLGRGGRVTFALGKQSGEVWVSLSVHSTCPLPSSPARGYPPRLPASCF